MPGEEMEISTDFGHQGHMDDIDIDLDFASGQQGEDLELGDYDQAEEFQHFNSDNRDELMAEDDDASYGMIDADDITYNEAAVSANDYDIDIGGTEDRSWQEAITTDQSGSADKAPEAETAASTGADIVPVSTGDELLLQVQPSTDDAASLPPAQQAEQVTEADVEAQSSNDVVTSGEEHVYLDSTASQDFGVPSEDAAQVQPLEVYSGEEVEAEQQPVPDLTSENTKLEDRESHETTTQPALHVVANPSNGTTSDEPASGEAKGDETGPIEEGNGAEISYDEQDEDSTVQEHTAVGDHQNGQEFPGQHADTTETEGEWNSGGVELNAETNELSDNSYDDVDEQVEHVSKEDRTQGQSESRDHEGAADAEGYGTGNEAPNNIEHESDDLASLAAQHQMFVRYGELDYCLFAKSLDDDPSEYFFKDISALELPLGEFLSGIRGVISEEVSPLDELVLHIDGLGLEFGESMTSRFLDEYSFAHILKLYHSLVKNDEPGDIPELYMYLMVRPSCVQRLAALQVQAESGRSLTDVAVYRDASPEQDDRREADQDQALAISPDYALDELYGDDGEEQSSPQPAEDDEYQEPDDQDNEYQDQDHDDQDDEHQDRDDEHQDHDDQDDEHQGHDDHDDEHQPEQDELEGHEELHLHDGSDAPAGTGEESAAGPNEDDLDYDNLDLSPSQQGKFPPSLSRPIPFRCIETVDCECDTCWGHQLEEESLRPRSASNQLGDVFMGEAPNGAQSSQVGFYGNTETTYQRYDANYFAVKDTVDNSTSLTATDANLTSTAVDSTLDKVDSKSASDEGHVDNPPSQSTSATATLDGDNDDEIDYDENDNEVGDDTHDHAAAAPAAQLMVPPVDEEITWESENEEARVQSSATSQPSEQVSMTPGKRTRSDSDAIADADGRKDVKRQRS